MSLKPLQPVPALDIQMLSGERFRLSERNPDAFTMIVFYRGLHCPICKPWLGDLDVRVSDFAALGVDAVAASCDGRERAAQSRSEWRLEHLDIGYGVGIPTAREWGLYISKGIKEGEPSEFSEPGLFLVRPDRTLYSGTVSTMPFARPRFEDVLGAVRFIVEKNYPPRGEA